MQVGLNRVAVIALVLCFDVALGCSRWGTTDRSAAALANRPDASTATRKGDAKADELATASRPTADEGPIRMASFEADVAADSFVRFPQDDAELPLSAAAKSRPLAVTSTMEPITFRGFLSDIVEDHRHYYSPSGMLALGLGFGFGATLANTSADEHLRDFYQENVRNTSTDEWSEAMHTPTVLGNGMMVLPVYGAVAMTGMMMEDMPMANTMGHWGEQTLRATLVGFPPMLLAQKMTGASRPDETSDRSQWKFWADDNGVSGHSFMGAVPFITAAKMTDDPMWKMTFYSASMAAGLSRINDDRHYSSQVILGWWMAYLAADAVLQTESAESDFAVVPLADAGSAGIGVEWRR